MFYFERKSKTPLYQQLYEQLRQQITEGLFPKGGKLPPTRELATEYHLSRNTVIQAYQQLEIEGYIRGTIGSGYYVEDLSPFPYSYCRTQPEESLFPKVEKSEILYDFYYGNLDYNCYQSKAWRRCLLDACDWTAAQKTVVYSKLEGLPALRHELANYLYFSRGVRCLADQIILTGGHQHSLAVLAGLFSCENWKFAMEDPGYNGTRIVMRQYGFSPVPIPVESDGISIAEAKRLSHALLYITPSHQFPMGSVLPIAKDWNCFNGQRKAAATFWKMTMIVSFATIVCRFLRCNPLTTMSGQFTWGHFPSRCLRICESHILFCRGRCLRFTIAFFPMQIVLHPLCSNMLWHSFFAAESIKSTSTPCGHIIRKNMTIF